jgi:hypothetical protein
VQCPLLAQSGHRFLRRTCLLLTQSGHKAAPFQSLGLAWYDPPV